MDLWKASVRCVTLGAFRIYRNSYIADCRIREMHSFCNALLCAAFSASVAVAAPAADRVDPLPGIDYLRVVCTLARVLRVSIWHVVLVALLV